MTGDSSSLTARYMSVALKQLVAGVSVWVGMCVCGWVREWLCGGYLPLCSSCFVLT